jgi:uncharacterized protein (DUF433 family)
MRFFSQDRHLKSAVIQMTQAFIEHIVVDEKGVARIAGSRIKVIHLVMEKMAYGWSADEIQAQHPHLSLADVHAAFTYYYDHKADLDSAIEEDNRCAEAMRAQVDQSWLVEKLRAKGKLP